MTASRNENEPGAAAKGRTPGRYVVVGLLLFGAVFLGFMMLLALKLDPAADRFHKNHPKFLEKK